MYKPGKRPAGVGSESSSSAFKKPHSISNTSNKENEAPTQTDEPPAQEDAATEEGTRYHSVLYIKREAYAKRKATKAWNDGVLSINPAGHAVLFCLSTGKTVSSGKAKKVSQVQLLGAAALSYKDRQKLAHNKSARAKDKDDDNNETEEDDKTLLLLNSMVLELENEMPATHFKSGACFTSAPVTAAAIASSKPHVGPPTRKGFKVPTMTGRPAAAAATRPVAKPLHDVSQPGSVVLNEKQWNQGAGKLSNGKEVVPVSIDPYLRHMLRPHQVEGVKFVYECVMGLKNTGYNGCVLADEMMLTLIWTLLRQGPEGKPVASKVLVVTPATLCANWQQEMKRWLGSERLQVFMLMQQHQDAQSVLQFKHGSVAKMCVTSYETFRKHATALAGTFDLLICDEGHRLKSVGGNKTMDALQELNCPRRVLLTGTPVQNNLQEFFALLSFVAPDLLGTPQTFKRVYADPIAKSHDRNASEEEVEIGAARSAELNRKVSSFVLRRTQAVLAQHLPPLTNAILFCKPTPLQETVYKEVLKGFLPAFNATSSVQETTHLLPSQLLASWSEDAEEAGGPSNPSDGVGVAKPSTAPEASAGSAGAQKCVSVPPGMALGQGDPAASGKMLVLAALLDTIIAAGDRVVIVSTSTAALNCIDELVVKAKGLTSKRIDGSVGVDERQSSVNAFNSGIGQVFFLSTRAGGAGLNLIGANHLVLYDSDWNPAADKQAMGRIWRDGQTKPCAIWRLLSTGTMEEKVYMRQLMKGDLAIAMGAGEASNPSSKLFSRDELRQLFMLSSPDTCETKDLLDSHPAKAAEANTLWITASDHHSMVARLPTHIQPGMQATLKTNAVTAASLAGSSVQALPGPL